MLASGAYAHAMWYTIANAIDAFWSLVGLVLQLALVVAVGFISPTAAIVLGIFLALRAWFGEEDYGNYIAPTPRQRRSPKQVAEDAAILERAKEDRARYPYLTDSEYRKMKLDLLEYPGLITPRPTRKLFPVPDLPSRQ
jgi:hypothetical protein